MSIRAAAVEVDITPARLPIQKPGWIVPIYADHIADPINAKIILIESAARIIGFVSLDVLSIRWPEVERIRDIAAAMGIAKDDLMIAATHNHTGPAVSSPGLATRDAAYVDFMIERVHEGLQQAANALAPARIAIGSGIEGRISFIRRCVMKDGSVKTHPAPSPLIRCAESVIDPEVGLLSIRDERDNSIGIIVNFACHPTHGGGEQVLSAGWPGELSRALRQSLGSQCVTCFLNGALGDVHHQSTLIPDYVDTKEHIGNTLAAAVVKTLPTLKTQADLALASAATTIQIPYRDMAGPFGIDMKNRQRFASDEVYAQLHAKLRKKIAERDHVLAQVQCIRIGNTAFVSLPCEPFSQIGFDIKSASPFENTYVVGCANGMIGYVPTLKAFANGGYEVTLSMGNKLDPSAAERLTRAAVELLRECHVSNERQDAQTPETPR